MTLHFDLPGWIIYSYLFVIGTVIGSFLNVCVYRIPPEARFLDQLRALWNRPSQCPRCRTDILWTDNIPIFGWFKLRGRCRTCKMWISFRYPLVEFLNGCLFVLVFYFEVPISIGAQLSDSCVFSEIGPQVYPGLGWMSPEFFLFLRFVFHLVMIEALLVASLIDFDLRIIPDGSTLPAMMFALLASTILGTMHIVPVWFQNEQMLKTFEIITPEWLHPLMASGGVPDWVTDHPHWHGFLVSLIGLIVGGGIVWIVRLLGYLFLREEAMGFGDVILMAMVGSFLGWQPTVIAFFLAPLFALLAVALTSIFVRNRAIPYGPYLSLGALVTVLFWKHISPVGMRFFEFGVLLVPVMALMLGLLAMSLGLVHLIKRILGILPQHGSTGVWRSADQICFFAGEKVNRHTCRWKTSDWDGCASGQGSLQEERWRDGKSPAPYQSFQLRRPRKLGD